MDPSSAWDSDYVGMEVSTHYRKMPPEWRAMFHTPKHVHGRIMYFNDISWKVSLDSLPRANTFNVEASISLMPIVGATLGATGVPWALVEDKTCDGDLPLFEGMSVSNDAQEELQNFQARARQCH